MYPCNICEKEFKHPTSMYRHRREKHGVRRDSDMNQPPLVIPSTTDQPTPAKVMKREQQNSSDQQCTSCQITIPSRSFIQHHRSNVHKSNCCDPVEVDGVFSIETAFKSRIASYRIPALHQTLDYGMFMNEIKEKVLQLVTSSIYKHGSIKINVELFGYYYLKSSGEFSIKSFNTRNEIITVATNLDQKYDSLKDIVLNKAQEFNENKSGKAFIFCKLLKIYYI